ncbi:carbohydrate ABC transporter permease [Micromonospora sp. HM5-17]|uniref:carbohydrate ABC transporter permease n=1 Tax=Micromonospora sp. HM5-17 TaxID=2487710 RepID=UPI001F2D53F3|nr:carbohydrate ABC transporter permease [Micromonospora sp. HM5-17]
MLFEPRWFRWVRRVGLVCFAGLVLLPLYVMATSAVKPLRDVQGTFRWIPSELTLRPFVDIWRTIPLGRYFVNSVVVATTAAICSVLVAIVAAYAISRFRFPGRRLFSVTVLSTQMLPGILFLLPLFLIYVNLDRLTGITLYGSRLGLVVTYLTFSLPFSIWMLVGYFNAIPRELDEAALVDGAGPVGALVRVVLPVAVPGVVAVAVYAFVTAWSEVLFASIMTSEQSRTLPVGLQLYSSQAGVYWNQVMAASLVVSVPVAAGFLLLQRFLVQGLTAGAVR